VFSHLKYYYRQRYLLWVFVLHDLKSRFSGSVMGIYWSVVNPLLMILIYTIVFSEILKIEFHRGGGNVNFALYMVCGLLPWLALQESLQRGTLSIVGNANLIKRPHFPASLLPIHIVISSLITEAIGLLLLLVLIVAMGYDLGLKCLALPVIVLPQLLFTLGLAWALGGLQVLFKDVSPLINSFLLLWMFMTPIFYPSTAFPDSLHFLLVVNPMVHIVDTYRLLIMMNEWPLPGSLLIAYVSAVVTFLAGYAIHTWLQPRFADLV